MVQRIKLSIVNAFLLEAEEGFILVDTGVSGKWDTLEAKLLEVGALPDRLKLVILTHGDFDHIGNGAKLQAKYKVKIGMHESDTLMAQQAILPKRKVNNLLMKMFVACGNLFERLSKGGFETFKPDLYLKDGQSLDEYGIKGQIVHVPGHTKGSIAVLTQEKDLIAGDLFSNMGKPGLSPFVENEEERIESVKRIKALKIKDIYPGHGNPFSAFYLFGVQEENEVSN